MSDFNANLYTRENGLTLTDLIGNFGKGVNRHFISTKGVYVNFSDNDMDYWKDDVIEIDEVSKVGNLTIYQTYIKGKGDRLPHEFGYLLTKDDVPIILSLIPGDNYGANIFKGVFTVTGHDGSYKYDIDNPSDNQRDLR
jgi:hypothetical protein